MRRIINIHRVLILVRRLQNCEEQEGVRRHSDARRTGRVGGQIRAADSWYGRLGVAVPVGHGHGRQPAGGRRSDHPSAAQGIVVARLAVHLSVRHAIVATAIPRRRSATAFSGVTVPSTAAEQHTVARHRRLLFRAADRRQLDRGHRR